jgi:hypothetical protein
MFMAMFYARRKRVTASTGPHAVQSAGQVGDGRDQKVLVSVWLAGARLKSHMANGSTDWGERCHQSPSNSPPSGVTAPQNTSGWTPARIIRTLPSPSAANTPLEYGLAMRVESQSSGLGRS